jgi:hypothetical protein
MCDEEKLGEERDDLDSSSVYGLLPLMEAHARIYIHFCLINFPN